MNLPVGIAGPVHITAVKTRGLVLLYLAPGVQPERCAVTDNLQSIDSLQTIASNLSCT